jgi:hypothetical protein
MTSSSRKTDPLHGWLSENVRLTAFTNQPYTSAARSWWEKCVGQDATEFSEKPTRGEIVARLDSPDGSFKTSLSVSPTRIDWQTEALPIYSDAKRFGELPNCGTFSEALARLDGVAQRWLPIASPITRLAFGCVLLQPVGDKNEGYSELGKFLNFLKIDAKGSQDLLYQINRPRTQKVTGKKVVINRLSRWSVGELRPISISIGSEGVAPVEDGPSMSFIRLQMDMNTVGEPNVTFDPAAASEIWPTLLEFAREIVAKGDVP